MEYGNDFDRSEWVRKIRHEIDRRCDNDVRGLSNYYKHIQEKYSGRLVNETVIVKSKTA